MTILGRPVAHPAVVTHVIAACLTHDVLVYIAFSGRRGTVFADGHTASNAPDLF